MCEIHECSECRSSAFVGFQTINGLRAEYVCTRMMWSGEPYPWTQKVESPSIVSAHLPIFSWIWIHFRRRALKTARFAVNASRQCSPRKNCCKSQYVLRIFRTWSLSSLMCFLCMLAISNDCYLTTMAFREWNGSPRSKHHRWPARVFPKLSFST